MNYIINCDWLSLSIIWKYHQIDNFDLVTLPQHSRQFALIQEIKQNGSTWATIQSQPPSGILDENMAILKISNWVLYQNNAYEMINFLLTHLKADNIKLSRADICADFTAFANHINPHNLIYQFMANKIRKVGYSSFSCFGKQKSEIRYEYLRFAQKKGNIEAYLYNKTEEMKQVKLKSYIVDCWQSAGIDITKNVWRLEFSLSGSKWAKVDKTSGETQNIKWQDFFNDNVKRQIYLSAQLRYFEFRRKNGQTNVSRMKTIPLFLTEPIRTDLYLERAMLGGNRTDKIVIKKLDNMIEKLTSANPVLLASGKRLLRLMIREEGLADWYLDKVNNIVKKEVVEDAKKEKVLCQIRALTATINEERQKKKEFNLIEKGWAREAPKR